MSMIWREFKPALKFLGLFLLIYFLGNLVYGLFIESFRNTPDPVTIRVSRQVGWILNLTGRKTEVTLNPSAPTVLMKYAGNIVVSIYEGCNGVNVMIVFVAFLVAFGGSRKKMIWFMPAGLIIIHVANLFRVGLLYVVAQSYSRYFYYIHKYVFTAIIYVIVFALWYTWIRLNGKSDR
jgi:exosortase family protein XrtF